MLQYAVTNVEKHFGELCQVFATYMQKTPRVRDKADILVNEIHLKQGLKSLLMSLPNFRITDKQQLKDLKPK